MDSPQAYHEYHAALAALRWQLEMGASEAIGDVPVSRFDLPEKSPASRPRRRAAPPPAVSPTAAPAAATPDPVTLARQAAAAAADLPALEAAIAAFEHCELKRGARNTVFADGHPSARVMVIGEAPGRDEDRLGRPFVGRAGQLLDRMLAAIHLDRTAEGANGVYITNVLPWRPPQNREPTPEEMAMLTPFLERHVELAAPDLLILMGNTPCQALLGRRGITRMRGKWDQAMNLPVMPMFHPAYLLRNPAAKREAWADLLEIQDRLRHLAPDGRPAPQRG